MSAGGCLVAVAQWQNTGSSGQKYPGFDSWWLPAFSLSSIFVSKTSNLSLTVKYLAATVVELLGSSMFEELHCLECSHKVLNHLFAEMPSTRQDKCTMVSLVAGNDQ